jgi:hypothetical protein
LVFAPEWCYFKKNGIEHRLSKEGSLVFLEFDWVLIFQMDSDIVRSERVCPVLVVCCDLAPPGRSFVIPNGVCDIPTPAYTKATDRADLATPVLTFLPVTCKPNYSSFCLGAAQLLVV